MLPALASPFRLKKSASPKTCYDIVIARRVSHDKTHVQERQNFHSKHFKLNSWLSLIGKAFNRYENQRFTEAPSFYGISYRVMTKDWFLCGPV